ncbi:MAG TPA: hypothetical protein VGV13_13820 [Methylomirabilota bacterium]|jgi:hypothetical protein|nr:hypothetical protein [Methylomirabilota bacterium]
MRAGYRLHWDAEHGWILDVPVTLQQDQLRRIARWALPRQIDRYRALPPGGRRVELNRAIGALTRGEIRQRLVDHDGDGVSIPFASTERVNPERRIFA